MHELSLAGGIVLIVEDAQAREGFTRVKRLRVEAGALSGVDVRALRFACEASFAGTCLQSAELEIEEPPASAWCMKCSHSVKIISRLDACPDCGGHQLHPTSGLELKVLEMIVDDEPIKNELTSIG